MVQETQSVRVLGEAGGLPESGLLGTHRRPRCPAQSLSGTCAKRGQRCVPRCAVGFGGSSHHAGRSRAGNGQGHRGAGPRRSTRRGAARRLGTLRAFQRGRRDRSLLAARTSTCRVPRAAFSAPLSSPGTLGAHGAVPPCRRGSPPAPTRACCHGRPGSGLICDGHSPPLRGGARRSESSGRPRSEAGLAPQFAANMACYSANRNAAFEGAIRCGSSRREQSDGERAYGRCEERMVHDRAVGAAGLEPARDGAERGADEPIRDRRAGRPPRTARRAAGFARGRGAGTHRRHRPPVAGTALLPAQPRSPRRAVELDTGTDPGVRGVARAP